MDPIRKAFEEVYGERHFSNQRKQETLKVARGVKGKKRMFAIAIAVTIMAAALLFSLAKPSNQHVSISTQKAQETVEEAYMERFQAAMVTDDEEAIMAYLSESDWLLQRAIESGESSFYQTPELTPNERRNLSALLYYMYLWRIEVQGAKPPIPNVTSFDEMRRQSASLVETYERFFPDRPFVSSDEEHNWLSYTYFGSMTKENQWGLIWIIVGFAALFQINVKMKSNRFFKAIPILIILMCIVPFLMPATEKYAYDEASILKTVLDEKEIEGARLTDAATFGDNRYALITTAEGINYFAHFTKKHKGYVLQNSEWGKYKVMSSPDFRWNRHVIGFHDGHEITRIDLVGDEESEGTVIPVEIEEGTPTIRAIVKPENFRSFHYEYYNSEGEKIY